MTPPPMTIIEAWEGSGCALILMTAFLGVETVEKQMFHALTIKNTYATYFLGGRMSSSTLIETKISKHYADLSGKLQDAADFILSNPIDVASRSLRSIAGSSDISPATYSRLARALGYQSYEELREESRKAVSGQIGTLSERARRIRVEQYESAEPSHIAQQSESSLRNIALLAEEISIEKLEAAASAILNARKVNLIGSLASYGVLDYFSYLAGWFTQNWMVAGRNGVTLASMLSHINKDDIVIVLSMAPFAKRSLAASKQAMEKGAKIIVITDSHTFPGLHFADHRFIIRTQSPHFFSSYAAVIVFLEALIGQLVSLSGERADQAIFNVERENRRLEEL